MHRSGGILDILCIGGGPAGLYFALLHKKAHPADRVTVVEQNQAETTYGWGVVFSDTALSFVSEGDDSFMQDLLRHLERWDDLTIVHRDVVVPLDGHGFTAVARIGLLRLLQHHCTRAGVDLRFGMKVDAAEPRDHDLVVAADGVNSSIRRQFVEHFEPTSYLLQNRYAWYGTTRIFDTLSLIFREYEDRAFVAHTYRFSPTASTFIVECDADTWDNRGFGDLNDADRRALCERVFAADLQGHPLLSNRSAWTRFNVLSNRRWHHRNVALIGDALRTVHFSIGSGTRLALEDAIALHRAMENSPTVPQALEGFEAARRPVVDTMLAAAAGSYTWYDGFHEHMKLPPLEFAMSYLTRSGRVTRQSLETRSPRFLARYDAWAKP